MDFSLPNSQDKLEHKKINYNNNNFFQRKYLILLVLSIILLAANSALYFFILKDTPFYIYALSSIVAAILITFFSHKLSESNEETNRPPQPIHVIDPNPESKQELEEILHAINEGVILVDLYGKITLVSRKALEILRTSMATIADETINQILPHSLEEEKNKNGFRIKYSSMTGEPIIINVKTYPYYNLKRELAGTIYLFSDVTKELTFESMKLDFVAIAAHQLRTPLTAIQSYLFLLNKVVEDQPTKLDENEKEYLNRSIISAERLNSLIENLLNVSKIEGGKLKVSFHRINLSKIISNTVKNLSNKAKDKKIEIITENSLNPQLEITGDANLLEAAFTNIIDNAINYNKEGGWVNISLKQHPNDITIHISDSGRGIPGEAIPLLFTKFFRVSNSLTQLSNGIGLGLFIAKSIFDAHNANIEVNSIEGRGTTVSISFPFPSILPIN